MGEPLMMKRRDVLFGLGLAPLAVAVGRITSADAARAPYVNVGDFPDSIAFHLWERPLLPVGPLLVTEVLPWDGTGYPVIVATLGRREQDWVRYPGGYDHDWSVLRRDVPADFWRWPSSGRYPNVHAYIREQRFGEPPSVMLEAMERNRLAPRQPRQPRQRVAPLVDAA